MNQKVTETIKAWRASPLTFVREVFGAEPDLWQQEILEALPHNSRMAMQACKGPGKTCLLAWIALWFITCYPMANVVVMSITRDNLNDGLWKELGKWLNKSDMLKAQFEHVGTRLYNKEHPKNWWISARSFAKDADSQGQADALAGLHEDYIMIILDESGGIPVSVAATAEAILSSCKVGKVIQAGNPTDLDGALYAAAVLNRDKYYVVEITGDPDDPKRSPRIDPEWARQQIEMFGRDNPWVLVNVFGKFPPSSIHALIGEDEVRDAQNRRFDEDAVKSSQLRLGVDVARFGDDRTVFCLRQGKKQWFLCEPLRNQRTQDIVGRVCQAIEDHDIEAVFIDDTGGYGGGVVDLLEQYGHAPIPVNFGSKADDPRYYNKRAEMWYRMAEWIRGGGVLEQNSEWRRELCSITYSFQNEKLLLEDKKNLKKRLGYSPDLADSLALTFAIPDVLTRGGIYDKRIADMVSKKQNWDYDPLGDDAW